MYVICTVFPSRASHDERKRKSYKTKANERTREERKMQTNFHRLLLDLKINRLFKNAQQSRKRSSSSSSRTDTCVCQIVFRECRAGSFSFFFFHFFHFFKKKIKFFFLSSSKLLLNMKTVCKSFFLLFFLCFSFMQLPHYNLYWI